MIKNYINNELIDKRFIYNLAQSGISKYAKSSRLPIHEDVPVGYDISLKSDGEIIYDCAPTDTGKARVFYISDVHLEHQIAGRIDFSNKSIDDTIRSLRLAIRRKLHEMLVDLYVNKDDLLLIGGDVADSIELSGLFYQELCKQWPGEWIIAILGNHELWDGRLPNELPVYRIRTVSEIIKNYRFVIENSHIAGESSSHIRFLENQVWMRNKYGRPTYHTEKYLLEVSEEELKKNLTECSEIILGGIGFSGLNAKYNAENGFYGKTITSQKEDEVLSRHFRIIHDKIKRCIPDKRVIVLTHTPVYDWTNESPNNDWIYVNGHTHINAIHIEKDGPTIISDNQIGYELQKWKLRSFIIDHCWYDPFECFDDGIYEITKDQYLDFSRGRGIHCEGCNYSGIIYALKKKQIYMFILKASNSMCILSGGRRKKLKNRDINYYYNEMERYMKAVKDIVKPYEEVIRKLSNEVKSFGGSGKIHGCIVDISYYSHIYLNPLDGTICPYWAIDMNGRDVYRDVSMLLRYREYGLYQKFKITKKERKTPLLELHSGKKAANSIEEAILPEWVTGTDIYRPSFKMREIQYAWEKNVIRTWQEHLVSNEIKDKTTTHNCYLNCDKNDENTKLGQWQALEEIKKYEEFRKSLRKKEGIM